ncbi:hypothetical protein L7F22_047656 [Adiantum nelumboides]|nr:hypothetical protein [Adiantum nelumboides]
MYINAHELGSTIPLVNDQAFDKSIKNSISAYMIFVKDSLNGVNKTQVNESGIQEDLELSNFLNQFQDMFIHDIPEELPPKRGDDDHMIELIPGSSPLNKPPYRVSQAQQEEIMRQVNELVEKGMPINEMAYQLKLPNHWLIHNAFRVSLLKPYKGEPPKEAITEDPPKVEGQKVLQPESVLRHEDKVLRHVPPLLQLPNEVYIRLIKTQCPVMGKEVYTVDLNKPLVFQVGYLGDAYQEWVHQPILSKHTPRFFESNFCEFFTRTVWWIIPLVWLPVVAWNQVLSVQRGMSPQEAATLMFVGVFVWTLMEYSLHRFLFHIKTSSYWGNTLHYLLHGCHHKHPMDGYRLVFPPVATALLAVPFWLLVRVLFPYNAVPAAFGGGLLGYVMYDVTHYYLHHGNAFNEATRKLKKYHLNHHFREQTNSFGITSSLWDWVFGTLPYIKQQ